MSSPPKLSRFLTTWFFLDAALNGISGIVYTFGPRLFFAGIGGPYGADVTPNLIWTVWTQASYFLLASGCMVVAALSKDPTTRRRLAIAFAWPGILQAVTAILRGTMEGGSVTTVVVSLVIIAVVVAPYVFFTVVRYEESLQSSWMHSAQENEDE